MVLVDTIILDVIEEDPVWVDWSQRQLDQTALNDALVINPVIHAELSIAFHRIEELEAMLAQGGFIVESKPLLFRRPTVSGEACRSGPTP